jgi:hypothetical protein
MKLESLLVRIFQNTQRLVQGAHTALTTFIGQYDNVILGVPEEVDTSVNVYPLATGYWADNERDWDPDLNIRWDEGSDWDE